MTTAQRRDRMPPGKRRHLVLAAAEEFAARGFPQASVNRILATCGMSKSSLYHVVDSKAELLDLVVRDLSASIGERWAPPDPTDFADDFWARTEKLITELGVVAQTDPDFVLLGRVFYLSADSTAASEVFASVRRWLDGVLAIGRESGQVDGGLPADLQADVVFAVLRAFDEWTLRQRDDVDDQLVSGLVGHQFAALRRLLSPSTADD